MYVQTCVVKCSSLSGTTLYDTNMAGQRNLDV